MPPCWRCSRPNCACLAIPHSSAVVKGLASGELWAIGRDLLVDNEYGRLVPVKSLEAAYWETLTRSVDFMQARLCIQPPYTVEFGGAGLNGYSLAITIDSPYEMRDDVFSETFVLTEASRAAIDSALLRIYEAFFRRAGYPRPSNLYDFPSPAGR